MKIYVPCRFLIAFPFDLIEHDWLVAQGTGVRSRVRPAMRKHSFDEVFVISDIITLFVILG
jgi:hypothetical protein